MDSEFEISQSNVRRLLQNGSVYVTFTKVDGTERTMHCTLNESLIPVDKLPKNADTKKKDGNTVAVWDIDSVGWRSFRIDCITNIHK